MSKDLPELQDQARREILTWLKAYNTGREKFNRAPNDLEPYIDKAAKWAVIYTALLKM